MVHLDGARVAAGAEGADQGGATHLAAVADRPKQEKITSFCLSDCPSLIDDFPLPRPPVQDEERREQVDEPVDQTTTFF